MVCLFIIGVHGDIK